jgi:hypothetical protein
MTINKLFDLLDNWRHLPAYQLERRADIFFAIHLETIIEQLYGIKADLIIPEFPVRIGEISENKPDLNRSFKIDYFVYSRQSQKVLLIELKTDQRSLRDKQTWYLESAANIKVSGLLNGLKKIYSATSQKVKYDHLLNLLEGIEWIRRVNDTFEVTCPDIEPEVTYIQPVNPDSSTNVISFDDIITTLDSINNPLTSRFIQSLENWKTDTNKKL